MDWTKNFGRKPVGRNEVGRKLGARVQHATEMLDRITFCPNFVTRNDDILQSKLYNFLQ